MYKSKFQEEDLDKRDSLQKRMAEIKSAIQEKNFQISDHKDAINKIQDEIDLLENEYSKLNNEEFETYD